MKRKERKKGKKSKRRESSKKKKKKKRCWKKKDKKKKKKKKKIKKKKRFKNILVFSSLKKKNEKFKKFIGLHILLIFMIINKYKTINSNYILFNPEKFKTLGLIILLILYQISIDLSLLVLLPTVF